MLIQATLRNACGLDISSDSHCLYMAIMSTVHLSVDVENGDPVLVLTYDLKNLRGGQAHGYERQPQSDNRNTVDLSAVLLTSTLFLFLKC